MSDMIARDTAVEQVRSMAIQFADMYFCFVDELRTELGEEVALRMVRKVLFRRARERAAAMVERAEARGIERLPENMNDVYDIAFIGWLPELGREHCPFGVAWNARIAQNPWFRRFASLYCDVMDTTVAEAFTGRYSHKLYKNVVLGDATCERAYYIDDKIAQGGFTYE